MRILILADHCYRDVPGLVSVQVNIERISDHHVQIVDIHLFQQMVEIFKPGLVVIPHLHDKARNSIVDTVRRRGGLCAVLPNESRPNTVAQTKWITQDFPSELCDLFLCWTEWIQGELNGRVPTAVTGCPRFDFYFRPVDKQQIISEYNLDPDRPIITVASSFPQAKFATLGGEFLEQDWKNLGVSKIEGREDPKAIARGEAVALDRFNAWLSVLHAEYPEFQIVLKPHPAEDVRFWMVQDKYNLVLSDYITNVLAISDVHIARVGCLTIPEAWILHKPTVQCRVGNEFVDGATQDALNIDPASNTVLQFLEEVENKLALTPDEDRAHHIYHGYVDKYLGPMPGSAERVAKALVKLLEEKNPKTAFDFSHQDLINMNRLLVDHSKANAIPSFDHIGQWAKVVTYSRINDWLAEERA